MASIELNKDLSRHLTAFGQTQKNIGDIQNQQTHQDVLHLANTLDEYCRLISAAKNSLSSRLRALQNWKNAEQQLVKSRINLEKTRLSSKTKADKVAQAEAEIKDCEEKVVSTKREFELISQRLKAELSRFEDIKVTELQRSLKGFLQALHESQLKVCYSLYVHVQEILLDIGGSRMGNFFAGV